MFLRKQLDFYPVTSSVWIKTAWKPRISFANNNAGEKAIFVSWAIRLNKTIVHIVLCVGIEVIGLKQLKH